MTNARGETTTCTPTLALPKEHPTPWSYHDEMGHLVRDANGAIVFRCVKISKDDEQKLVCAITSIPNMLRKITHHRVLNAEMKSRVAKLEAERCALKTTVPHGQRARIEDAHIVVAAKLALSNTDRAIYIAGGAAEDVALVEANISFLNLIRALTSLSSRFLTVATRASGCRLNALRGAS